MKGKFKAGVAVRDISPKQGLQLAGYPHYERKNVGIHDPLYANCLYLDNTHEQIIIVALDLVKYSKDLVKTVRYRVQELSGIPGKNIMITCTHTHSGPTISTRIDMEGLDNGELPSYDYLNEIEDKIVDGIMEAYNNAFPAKIGIGMGICGREEGVGGNRRDPDGPADPEVWTIAIQDMEGRCRGCAVKYALHPTLLHGESKIVSSDYPCYLRRYLSEQKPGIVTLFLQGTSGNQSSRYFRTGQTFGEAKRVGEAIAKEADSVINSMEMSDEADLCVVSGEVNIDIRALPPLDEAEKNIKKAQEDLENLRKNNAPYADIRTGEVNLLGAENTYGYSLAKAKGYKVPVLEDELPVEIQVIGIQDSRMVGIQGELFVEYGYTIKSLSPFDKTFIVELANGALPGYLCTKEAYEQGGYEAGTSLLTGKFGDEIVAAAADLINRTR